MTVALVIARRFLTERRLLVGGVALGAAVSLALQIGMYPSLRDSLGEMTEALPEAFTQLVGSEEFASPEGFLQAEAYGTIGPILVILVAISMASSGLPGAESSGRMAMLATSSATRRSIALGVWLSLLGAISVVVGVYWVTTVVGSAAGGLEIGVGRLTAAAVSLWLLGAAVGALAFGAGCVTGRRGPTVGGSATVAVASFLVYGLFPLSDRLAPARRLSLWFPYADHEPLVGGFDPAHASTLAAIAALGAVVGVWAFERRDLG
ncbi:MAG: hypothetical protein RIB98_02970 [Acidimicrobiales bacterium]